MARNAMVVTWKAVAIIIITIVLINIGVGYIHLDTINSLTSSMYLRQTRELFMRRDVPQPTPGFRHNGRWLEKLYSALEDEVLLTRNIRSKEHLWRNIESSPHFGKEEGEVLVFLGWVAYWDMELYALHGEPSGEFVIFADLITGLAALGYNVTVVHTICDFWERVSSSSVIYDIVITDYDGLGSAENVGDFPFRHCNYFIVDGFGTQPEFNKRNMDLKRVLTPYPFEEINTPIHFIADQLPQGQWVRPKKRQAVIWAKSYQYIHGKLSILKEISEYLPLVGTFGEDSSRREIQFIKQYPFMNRTSFLQLLSSSLLLIGVGNPLDGPTALEAIAHGCAYINPRFSPPIQAVDKPTRYLYSSQHPFAEKYIPSPHVYTVDFNDSDNLHRVIKKILEWNQTIPPFIHPWHKPENFIQNLRGIFSPSKRSACKKNELLNPPSRHPNNKVYPSFLDFLQDSCGSECFPHWTQIKPSATPSNPSNSSSCISRFIDRIIREHVPYEIRGDSLYVIPKSK